MAGLLKASDWLIRSLPSLFPAVVPAAWVIRIEGLCIIRFLLLIISPFRHPGTCNLVSEASPAPSTAPCTVVRRVKVFEVGCWEPSFHTCSNNGIGWQAVFPRFGGVDIPQACRTPQVSNTHLLNRCTSMGQDPCC
jgi:hypothetical protein